MLVKISDIKVKKRVRQDLGDLEGLKDSLKTYGLLNPVTLNADMELVAGQRRLEAAKAIGWETINAVVLDRGVDKVRQLELELEENNLRKDFNNDELMAGYGRLEKLRNPSFIGKASSFFQGLVERTAIFFGRRFGGRKAKKGLPAPSVQTGLPAPRGDTGAASGSP